MEKLTRKERKDATSAKMITTARALFRQHGYDHVTIRDVAKAAGMSTGAVFATFKDKDDMFLKSIGHPAPNQERVTKILREIMKRSLDAYTAAWAHGLIADLYGEQSE